MTTTSAPSATVKTFCRLCEVACGLVAHVEDGRITRVRPDHDHPVTRGFACSKGVRGLELHNDPHRVRVPQRRVGDHFVDVSWDDALGDIAQRLRDVIDEHGPRAVGVFFGNPTAFNSLGAASAMMFAASLGSDRSFSSATQDCSNKQAVGELLYGRAGATSIPDIEHTELLLLIGTNPRVSHLSFFNVADPVAALRRVRDRGGRVVFVNPLEVEPAIGETLQVRPDTDAYLLAAMLHHIHRTVGFRPGALDGRLEGVDEVVEFVAPYSPEAVADVVGIPAERIAALADAFTAARGASIHASTGINMGRQGALAYWLVQMLVLLTGNQDRPGGNYFAARAFAAPPEAPAAPFESTPWGNIRRVTGFLPAALLPQYILEDDEPLRAVIVLAANPVLSVGGGERLRKAFESLELLVTIDLYRNATGELADYVLPGTDQFEREDINMFMQGFQAEPWLQWTPPVVQPDGEQRAEWRIFADIVQALGRTPLVDPDTPDPLSLLFDPVLAPTGLSMAAVREAGGVVTIAEPGPEGSMARVGLDGPLRCVPESFASTLARAHSIFEDLQAEPAGIFKLITRRTRTTMNSTLQNLLTDTATSDPNPLWMHPDDAAHLALAAGDRARVRNEWGSIESSVALDARLRPGVVAMTHGFGNDRTTGMPNAQRRAGVNVNELAPHGPGTFDPVSSMSQLTGIAVEISPA